MKEISKKLLLITALTAGCATPMHSAQYKHYARKAATAASWLGAIGIYGYLSPSTEVLIKPIRQAKYYFDVTHFDHKKASPLITDFVHTIMKREGIIAPESVHVYIDPSATDLNASAYRNKNFSAIIISEQSANMLTAILESRRALSIGNAKGDEWNPSTEESLDLFRATLSHEAAHIKHEHRKKLIIANIAIPATFLAVPFLPPLNTMFLYRRGLVALGAISYVMPNLLVKKFNRICETQADDAISVPSEMAADAKFYRILGAKQPPEDLSKYIKYTYDSLLATHPSNEERAERHESRLQRLQEGE